MKNYILAATAACGLAVAAVPAIAQMESDAETYVMTDAQEQMYMNWPAENRTTYQAWPMDAQEYFWTLNDNQKKIWWDTLNNDQRVKIVMMEPAQQTATWDSIYKQLNGIATPMATTSANAKITYTSNAMVQPTPGDAGPPPAKLPICEPMQQDNCINRGAI
jgi:hypothetical protein